MSGGEGGHGHGFDSDDARDVAVRRVLWWVLAINGTMFFVEGAAGLLSGSAALQADALDFLGDSLSYGVSLFVVGKSLEWRAGAGLGKGLLMAVFGAGVLAATAMRAVTPGVPEAATMGAIGFLALAANVVSAAVLYRFRTGDSNLHSVWLCSRNDAISNLAVLAAAAGVFASATRWPDVAVGLALAVLELSAAWTILRHAARELREGRAGAA